MVELKQGVQYLLMFGLCTLFIEGSCSASSCHDWDMLLTRLQSDYDRSRSDSAESDNTFGEKSLCISNAKGHRFKMISTYFTKRDDVTVC